MNSLLITGATGTVGSRLVRTLQHQGIRPRVLTRDLGRARTLLGAGGVGAPVPFWAAHGRIEAHLRASGVLWVMRQPNFFMTNLLGQADSVRQPGALVAPLQGARIAMIDPQDVAAVAASALLDKGRTGRTYVLSGAEVLSYDAVARTLSGVLGRPIRFVPLPEDAARAGLLASGLPQAVAEPLLALFAQLRQGAYAQVSDAVADLTGQPPRALDQFMREHAALFGIPENPRGTASTPSADRP